MILDVLLFLLGWIAPALLIRSVIQHFQNKQVEILMKQHYAWRETIESKVTIFD